MKNILQNKKAEMEMSVGTIVTLVLLMTALILGLIMTKTIFQTSTDNIKTIDQNVKNEINKLFSADDTKQIIIIPDSKMITLKKGESDAGFGFSIRNTGTEDGVFTYTVKATESSCKTVSLDKADSYIALGAQGQDITIAPSSIMQDPIFVRFSVPSTAPACQIRYLVNVQEGGQTYGSSVGIDVTIQSS